MSALIIDGNKISKEIRKELKAEVEDFKEKTGKVPGLAVVLVGEDPASKVYVRNKERACEEVGIISVKYVLAEDTSENELLDVIKELNEKEDVNGILVQLPLPKYIDSSRVIEAIEPKKDVDGFHPINVGKLLEGEDTFYPCTPQGIMTLLEHSDIYVEGKEAVIVGRSNIVGKPVGILLMQKNATVTTCHSKTVDLSFHTRRADILVVAIGRAQMIKKDMVKEGAVVIDVGMNKVGDKFVGDVDFDEVSEKVAAITPVPGGVGPMTVTMLLKNTLKATRASV